MSEMGAAAPRNGKGIAALVLGIIGLVGGLCFVGWLPGLLAIIFGALGIKDANEGIATNKGMSIAGLVMGILAVVGTIAFVAFGVSVSLLESVSGG